MGCDIHFYSESRKGGKWVADLADTFTREREEGQDYDLINLDASYLGGRHYALFALLNRVRGQFEFSFDRKDEIPEDTSTEIREIYTSWDCDAHSASYLTVSELKTKAAELMVHPHEHARQILPVLTDLINGLPQTEVGPEHQRVVFWFDN